MTTHNPTTDLFTPTRLGAIALKNRIVMAPMTRSRAGEDGVPKPMHAEYYAQRASAGLLISEATNISPQGRGYAGTPGIWNDAQVAGWQQVTHAVHAAGGKIVMQLWHVGRLSHVDLQPGGAAPVAPSAIRANATVFTLAGEVPTSEPRALAASELPGIVAQYAQAARNAQRAGFDGVEIHAANNYLLEQFLRDSTNTRTDAYGGSAQNRARLLLDVVDAVVKVWGGERVGIRLSPVTLQLGNTPLDSDIMATYGYVIDQLNAFGLAYLHFVEGTTGTDRNSPTGVDLDTLRARFNGAFIGNNNYDLAMAQARHAAGKIDAVAFGRPFISNPDLVARLRGGLALTPPAPETFYGNSAKGLTDWPVAA